MDTKEAKQDAKWEKAKANLRATLKKVHPYWKENQIDDWMNERF